MLTSGLPEIVADAETLARFLMSTNHFNRVMVKPAAFMPSVSHRETSVFRHDGEPLEALWAIATAHITGRSVHGAALIKAQAVRAADLDVAASEPPPRHAVIVQWPWRDDNPDWQKAQQKERAMTLASQSILLRR